MGINKMSKLSKYFLKEAIKDINFAREKLRDKAWMQNACEYSKEMVRKNINADPKTLAKQRADYLRFRARAKGNVWGHDIYIDKEARKQYKDIVGRYA